MKRNRSTVFAVAAFASWITISPAHAQCTYRQMAKLGATDPQPTNLIGSSVGTNLRTNASGNRVAFSSGSHTHSGVSHGAAWVVSDPGTPVQSSIELLPTSPFNAMAFGMSLAMNATGDLVVVGAPTQPLQGVNLPRVFVYRLTGQTWGLEWETASPRNLDDDFGFATATNAVGDLIAVGAHSAGYGKIDVFRRDLGGWVLEKTIVGTPQQDGIGSRVALSADGSVLATRTFSWINGQLEIYQRNGGAWNWVANMHETVPHSSGGFGYSIAIDSLGETVVAGNPFDSRVNYHSGAVFIYRRGPSGWFLEGEMLPPAIVNGSAELGYSVAINAAGDRIFAGCPNYLSVGAVFEYERGATGWQQVGIYSSPNGASGFGAKVVTNAIGTRFIAAEPWADDFGTDAGVVRVFDSPCTEPTVYCTAQTNSLGCLPQIGSQGTPSASRPNGFSITASNQRNQRSGILFYGVNGKLAQTWNGGTLCVRSPLRRTPLQSSGGSASAVNDCSGSFTFDFNAWRWSLGDPTLFEGQHVYAQYFSRDPSPNSSVNLTDALEFYIEP